MLTRLVRPAMLTVVTALTAALLVAVPGTAEATFDDTRGSDVTAAVQALADEGVVNGCGDGSSFCPDQPITRGQVASLLVRALELPAADDGPFRDVEGTAHAESINALAQAGVTDGCSRDRFCPQTEVSRAQIASLLQAAFDAPSTGTAYFGDVGRTHGPSANALAADGIAAGCREGAFCPEESVRRKQGALFLARALDHVQRVEVTRLSQVRAERRATERDRVWDALAQCESGGNWQINTGNGYYGGLQFSLSSWRAVGGSGYPHKHSRAEQIKRAERLLDRQGWGAWPHCSRKLGYR